MMTELHELDASLLALAVKHVAAIRRNDDARSLIRRQVQARDAMRIFDDLAAGRSTPDTRALLRWDRQCRIVHGAP